MATLCGVVVAWFAAQAVGKLAGSHAWRGWDSPAVAAVCAIGVALAGVAAWMAYRRLGPHPLGTILAALGYLSAGAVLTSSLPRYLTAQAWLEEAVHWVVWLCFAVLALRYRDGVLAAVLLLNIPSMVLGFSPAGGAGGAATLVLPALLCLATWWRPFGASPVSTMLVRALAAAVVLFVVATTHLDALFDLRAPSWAFISVLLASAAVFAAGELLPEVKADRQQPGADCAALFKTFQVGVAAPLVALGAVALAF